jgi:hypothetical protein
MGLKGDERAADRLRAVDSFKGKTEAMLRRRELKGKL